MVRSHARALTLMAAGLLAGARAYLLLTIRLDNVDLAWGHDEYLYQVLSNHAENRIPKEGMVMIRYHSFYPWHNGGSYESLMSPEDYLYKEWILDFNKYDLYTKCEQIYDLDEMKDYYLPIAEKYLGKGPIYW